VIQDRHFNLVSYTLSGLSTRPTTNDAYYSESGIGTRQRMGIQGGHYGLTNSSYFSGQQIYTWWRNPPAGAGLRTFSTINTRGNRGLVAWSEEQFGAELSLTA
jgi:hypothetical protein